MRLFKRKIVHCAPFPPIQVRKINTFNLFMSQ